MSALVFCPSVMAQEQNGWQLDSLQANSSVSKPDAQQIDEVLLKMFDRWMLTTPPAIWRSCLTRA